MSEQITIDPDYVETWGFDYAMWPAIERGDRIVSAVVSVSPAGPTIGTYAIAVSDSDPSKPAAQVNVPLSGWSVGTYHIKVDATTNSGAVLPACLVVTVKAC